MSKRLFTSVFFLVLLAFMAGRSYACPILKAVISPSKPKWVHQGHELSFEGCTSVGSIAQCTWTLPGTYGDPNYWQHIYPNDHVRCRFGAPGAYTIILKVRDNQGLESTDTCTVYVVSIDIVIAPGESSYVAVNNDDDNENGIMDMCEGGQVSGENDLCKVLLSVSTPKITDTVSLGALPVGEPQMRVWGYPDRRNRLISTGDSIDTVEWPSGSVPTEVYVEASSYAAGFINSKYLRLYYTGVDCNTIPPTKYIVDRVPQAEIYFTFVEVDMDMAGVKDNYYETLEVTEETKPGGFIPLNGLVEIELYRLNPPELPVTLFSPVIFDVPVGSSKIRIWENEDKTGEVSLPKYYYFPWDVSVTLWVEGIETSSAPRDIQLLMQYGSFEDRIKATVAKVDKIQYWHGISSQWVDITGTIYVIQNDYVTFKAIPNPLGFTWPTDRPVWGGTSGASGTGETTTVGFNTLSSSSTDYMTVTAECGNTVNVNVIVSDFEGTLVPSDNFAGRSQTDYGLEEIVALGCNITPGGLTASQIGGLRWSEGLGKGSLSNITNNGTADYDAGAYPGTANLQLTVQSGPSQGAFKYYARTLVAPSDDYMIQKPGSGIRHTRYTCSAGFLGWSYLEPKDVSFENLYRREGTCTGTGTGYYANLNGIVHPTGSWWSISSGNSSTGCRVLVDDEVYSEKGPPYSNGQFDWPIPREYKADDGVAHAFTIANHNQVADPTGKCTIQKKGAGPFSKNANDPTSNWSN